MTDNSVKNISILYKYFGLGVVTWLDPEDQMYLWQTKH